VPTIHRQTHCKMVGTLPPSLVELRRDKCTLPTLLQRSDLLLVQAQIPCTNRDKSTRLQITSDFPKSRQVLRTEIFRLTRSPNQPHNSARLTR
jgi:hypothetical protein